MTLYEFAAAMRQLDLKSIPPDRRNEAINDHLARIMTDALVDRNKAQEIAGGLLIAKRTR